MSCALAAQPVAGNRVVRGGQRMRVPVAWAAKAALSTITRNIIDGGVVTHAGFAAHRRPARDPQPEPPGSAPTASDRSPAAKKIAPSGSHGMTPPGPTRLISNGASNTRPCIKSPPWGSTAPAAPLPTMKATTAGGLPPGRRPWSGASTRHAGTTTRRRNHQQRSQRHRQHQRRLVRTAG